jgi:hypothetical protein
MTADKGGFSFLENNRQLSEEEETMFINSESKCVR